MVIIYLLQTPTKLPSLPRAMAHTLRSTSTLAPGSTGGSSIRQPNGHHAISHQQSSALVARIAAKKAELDNLKQLRDLSDSLSRQMQALENKIATLNDGTEGRI